MKSILLISIFTIIARLPLADHWNADASKAKIMFSVKGPFGTVLGNFSGLKATIQFRDAGEKNLLLKYAKLKVVM